MSGEKFRELAKIATPGPWEWGWLDRSQRGNAEETYAVLGSDDAPVALTGRYKSNHADAAFIAAANPAAVLGLLDERDALRAIAVGRVRHRYMGDCPDDLDGFDQRDPKCPACAALGQP